MLPLRAPINRELQTNSAPLRSAGLFVFTADALFERGHQSDGLLALFQHVRESLSGDVLKAHTSVTHDCLNRFPGLLIELNALADHSEAPRSPQRRGE